MISSPLAAVGVGAQNWAQCVQPALTSAVAGTLPLYGSPKILSRAVPLSKQRGPALRLHVCDAQLSSKHGTALFFLSQDLFPEID